MKQAWTWLMLAGVLGLPPGALAQTPPDEEAVDEAPSPSTQPTEPDKDEPAAPTPSGTPTAPDPEGTPAAPTAPAPSSPPEPAPDPTRPPPGLTKAEELAWEAGQLMNEGNLAGAEAKASSALTVDPKTAAAHYQLARLKLRLGKLAEAEKHAQDAVTADPRYVPGQLVRLHLATLRDRAQAVLSDLQTLANENASNLGIQLALAQAELATKQHAAAMRIAREVLKKAETSVQAMKVLARAYLDTGKDAAAEAILARAIEVHKDAEALHLMAGIMLKRGKLTEARGWLEAAVQEDPSYVEALSNVGSVYVRVRNWEAADEALTKATRLAPGFAAAWLNLGGAQRGSKRFADAERSWKKALELDERMAEAHYNLGIMYLENPLEGRDRIEMLGQAIDQFNDFKKRVPAGEAGPDVEKYIGEARTLIEQEKKRREEEQKQPPEATPPPEEETPPPEEPKPPAEEPKPPVRQPKPEPDPSTTEEPE
jgi:Tfp pilus assembly protein PilF